MGILSDFFGYGDIEGSGTKTVTNDWADYIKGLNEDTLKSAMSVSLGGGKTTPFISGSQRWGQALLEKISPTTMRQTEQIEGDSPFQAITGGLGDLLNLGTGGVELYNLLNSSGLLSKLGLGTETGSGIDLGSAIGGGTLASLLGGGESSGIDLGSVIGSNTLESLLGEGTEKLVPPEGSGLLNTLLGSGTELTGLGSGGLGGFGPTGTGLGEGWQSILPGLDSAEALGVGTAAITPAIASAAAALGLAPGTYAAMLGSSGLGMAAPGTAAATALGSVGTGGAAAGAGALGALGLAGLWGGGILSGFGGKEPVAPSALDYLNAYINKTGIPEWGISAEEVQKIDPDQMANEVYLSQEYASSMGSDQGINQGAQLASPGWYAGLHEATQAIEDAQKKVDSFSAANPGSPTPDIRPYLDSKYWKYLPAEPTNTTESIPYQGKTYGAMP